MGPASGTQRRGSFLDMFGTASVASQASVYERSNNTKHYTENNRLEEVFRLYSTLEE